MQIEYRPGDFASIPCDLLAFPVFEDDIADLTPLEPLDQITDGAVKSVISSGEFKPKLHQTCKIYKPAGLNARYLLLIGAGKKDKFDPAKFREIVGTTVRSARSSVCATVAFFCRGISSTGLASRLAAEGALWGNYEADIYKTRDKEQKSIENFWILFEGEVRLNEASEGIRRGTIVGNAVSFARTLANEPSNILTPTRFAERAVKIGEEAGLNVQIIERDEMEKLGMNALLAVSRGSEEPPKLIVLRVKGQENRDAGSPLYALVGKGVTFDSGGISLKPPDKMDEMKGDMAGGAAVLAAMIALAQIGSRCPVIGLIPAVENLPSGKAAKPGDVIKSFLGKTVEIINTDAEGRLILADAMAYARTLGATNIVDIATLTAAVVVALGHINAGLMGTDQTTIDLLRDKCSITGEKLWQLPLDDEYAKAIKSEIADIKNVGNKAAGVITAAKFLQEFVEDTPWVHLDIAGMDIDHDGRPFACKGATGFGVRTLVQLLE
jgi:leucyl aminopeptidase